MNAVAAGSAAASAIAAVAAAVARDGLAQLHPIGSSCKGPAIENVFSNELDYTKMIVSKISTGKLFPPGYFC